MGMMWWRDIRTADQSLMKISASGSEEKPLRWGKKKTISK